jgi:hypothetical protein
MSEEIEDKKEISPEDIGYDSGSDTCVVKLEKELVFGSEVYTEITVKAPTWEALDLIKFNGKEVQFDMGTLRKLASKMTGLEEVRLKKLQGRDIKKIIDAVSFFLGKCLS